jgi:hypothetical protein
MAFITHVLMFAEFFRFDGDFSLRHSLEICNFSENYEKQKQ